MEVAGQPLSYLRYCCVCLLIVVSNTYYVLFLLCFSSSCVAYFASFSGFTRSSLPFQYSLTFICPVSCVPYVASYSGLSILSLPFRYSLTFNKLWPQMDLGKICSLIMSKEEQELEWIAQYKTHKAFSYFMSGFVDVKTCKRSILQSIKYKITPSQSVRNEPYDAWNVVSNYVKI